MAAAAAAANVVVVEGQHRRRWRRNWSVAADVDKKSAGGRDRRVDFVEVVEGGKKSLVDKARSTMDPLVGRLRAFVHGGLRQLNRDSSSSGASGCPSLRVRRG